MNEIRPRRAVRVEEQNPRLGGDGDSAVRGCRKAGVLVLADDGRGQTAGSFFNDLGRSIGGGVVDHHHPHRCWYETLHSRETGGEGLGVVMGDYDHRV